MHRYRTIKRRNASPRYTPPKTEEEKWLATGKLGKGEGVELSRSLCFSRFGTTPLYS